MPSHVSVTGRRNPPWVRCQRSGQVVAAAGTTSAANATRGHEPTRTADPGARSGRAAIAAIAMTAMTVRPGNTAGTKRRLAQGWDGVMLGSHQ